MTNQYNDSFNAAFLEDVRENRPSEYLAVELLKLMFPKCRVGFVADDKQHYHNGDIAIVKPDGKTVYVDVKNDKSWARYGNLNAEDELWKKNWEEKYGNGYGNGFMRRAKYDFVMYMDVANKQFLFISFRKWKATYNKIGYYTTAVGVKSSFDNHGRKVMKHPKNSFNPYEITYGYLNPVDKMIEAGVVIGRAYYDYDGSIMDFSNLHITDKVTYGKMAA
ncbi:hypothetical protein H7U34_01895 [Collinsella tanakaei]|nr:hypothetical protein [Collinsella tanakaei]